MEAACIGMLAGVARLHTCAMAQWSCRSLQFRFESMRVHGSVVSLVAAAAAFSHSSNAALAAAVSAADQASTPLQDERGRPVETRDRSESTTSSTRVGAWYGVPDLRLRDHNMTVPLDHGSTNSPHISLFVREVVAPGKEEQQMPYLLYLQGGPGFESPRPSEAGGWLKKACEEFRVILLDQRGTGLSTPLTTSSLSQITSVQQQADYLQHFRADNIVKDAEYVRTCLVPNGEPWTVLGQSYGGFCAVTYLSFAPAGLGQVLLTGGLPPLNSGCSAELVYHACFKSVLQQNRKFYNRFPETMKAVQEVVLHLAEAEGGGVPLPSGGILSPRGLQVLGLSGLGSSGGFERLHHLFERAWDPVLVPGGKKQLSYFFLRMFENCLAFDTNPLYALMHESIYCQGAASNWAAHRVREELGDQFDPVKAAKNGQPVLFTGEMVFPWMFDEIAALRPLKEVAYLLAAKEDWPLLYDKETLNSNKVFRLKPRRGSRGASCNESRDIVPCRLLVQLPGENVIELVFLQLVRKHGMRFRNSVKTRTLQGEKQNVQVVRICVFALTTKTCENTKLNSSKLGSESVVFAVFVKTCVETCVKTGLQHKKLQIN